MLIYVSKKLLILETINITIHVALCIVFCYSLIHFRTNLCNLKIFEANINVVLNTHDHSLKFKKIKELYISDRRKEG